MGAAQTGKQRESCRLLTNLRRYAALFGGSPSAVDGDGAVRMTGMI